MGSVATTQSHEVSMTSQSIANLKDKDFFEQQTELKQLAVDKWLSIVRNHTLSSEVGEQILSQCNLDNFEESRTIISAVIGTRSSTTAISRANAILRYLRWSGEHNEEQDPQTEASGWSYVKFLEQTGAAATTGSRWLSAVRYAVYIFGYKNMECICNSRRIQGKCDVMYVEKDDLNQAAPFTVSQVKELHRKISDDNIDVYDKAFIAFILTSIYTRSRHSDFRYISKVILDVDDRGGFVETRTRHHKTARSALKKTVLLPIIAPARGVDGSIWVHDVAKAFADIGLPFEDCTNNPLFRPVGADGTLCKRCVTSSETNKFLELLFPDVTLTSHSCKCTALSWAAKYTGLSLMIEACLVDTPTRRRTLPPFIAET